MQDKKTSKSSSGQIIALVVIAAALAVGYVGLDMYSDGQVYVVMTESRGTQIVQGLTKYKLEAKAYPDSLDKLAPKFIDNVPRCPEGEPFAYALAGENFTLGCAKVVFKLQPYGYDSRSRMWGG